MSRELRGGDKPPEGDAGEGGQVQLDQGEGEELPSRHGQNMYPCILDTGKVWSAWGNLESPNDREIFMIFTIYPNILVLRSITLFIIY